MPPFLAASPLSPLLLLKDADSASSTSGSSSSGAGDASSSSYACSCPFMMERPCRMRVNSAFTQLFGYSEADLTQMMLSRGGTAALDSLLYGASAVDWMPALITQAIASAPHQCASRRCEIVDRQGQRRRALVVCWFARAPHGQAGEMCLSFTPVDPETSSGGSSSGSNSTGRGSAVPAEGAFGPPVPLSAHFAAAGQFSAPL